MQNILIFRLLHSSSIIEIMKNSTIFHFGAGVNKNQTNEIGETNGPFNEIEKQNLQFMGHIMRHRRKENDFLTGMVFGKKSRGRQKTRKTNTIKEKVGLTMTAPLLQHKTERNGRTNPSKFKNASVYLSKDIF